jgi:hypothetical protein
MEGNIGKYGGGGKWRWFIHETSVASVSQSKAGPEASFSKSGVSDFQRVGHDVRQLSHDTPGQVTLWDQPLAFKFPWTGYLKIKVPDKISSFGAHT